MFVKCRCRNCIMRDDVEEAFRTVPPDPVTLPGGPCTPVAPKGPVAPVAPVAPPATAITT